MARWEENNMIDKVFFFQAEDGIRDGHVTGVQTCALPIWRWQDLADRTLAAFTEAYVGDDGRIRSDCATVYALAIAFDLLADGMREKAGQRLAQLVRERSEERRVGEECGAGWTRASRQK